MRKSTFFFLLAFTVSVSLRVHGENTKKVSIDKVINSGIPKDSGEHDIAIHGKFYGKNDKVIAKCSSGNSYTATIKTDSDSFLWIVLKEINDTCKFIVENAKGNTEFSNPIILSKNQQPIYFGIARTRENTTTLEGYFNAVKHEVFVACDGSTTYLPVPKILSDSANIIKVTIEAKNLNTCTYDVEGNNVWSGPTQVVFIESVKLEDSRPGVTLVKLTGAFVGQNDLAYWDCGENNSDFSNVLLTDSKDTVEFEIPASDKKTKCDFAVSTLLSPRMELQTSIFSLH